MAEAAAAWMLQLKTLAAENQAAAAFFSAAKNLLSYSEILLSFRSLSSNPNPLLWEVFFFFFLMMMIVFGDILADITNPSGPMHVAVVK